MENSLKGLLLAAGTIITCVVVSLGFYIAREAQATATGGADKINSINTEFMESDKTIYDGAVISGSEVIKVINKMKDEPIGVLVKNAKSEVYYGYSFDLSSGELKTESSTDTYLVTKSSAEADYINPYASFRGTVIRDSNNVITGLTFVQ